MQKNLPSDIDALKQVISDKDAEIKRQQVQIKHYKQELSYLEELLKCIEGKHSVKKSSLIAL